MQNRLALPQIFQTNDGARLRTRTPNNALLALARININGKSAPTASEPKNGRTIFRDVAGARDARPDNQN
eukprot:1327035-Lingulodinium_polyedra.AAC.1